MKILVIHKKYLILLLSILLLASCQTNDNSFSKSDVLSAQKVIGLDMSEEVLDTVYAYLIDNKEGYDSLRAYPIDNNVQPPLYFDPRPIGFQYPDFDESIEIDIDLDTEMPDNPEDLAFYPVTKLAGLIKSQKISSEELTGFFLDRLKKYNDTLECVITFTEDYALAQAKKADELLANGTYLGPLHGIPYGVKDLFAFKGYNTTWGAEPYKDQRIDQTATVIQKLEDAGAVLIAKLVSGALARGDIWFGGKTKNPWDLEQGASGSSAGSGSAMSAGLVGFSIGTETLGSIVSPANRNGVTGLRPTYGRVSKSGVMSLSWSMDKVGPLCRTAEDCALVLNTIYGYDKNDASTVDITLGANPKPLKDYKIAYLKADIDKDTTDAKGNNLKALEVFISMGFTLDSIELPKDIPYDGLDVILRAEAGAFFDDLVRSGDVDKMVQQSQKSRANSLRQARFIPAVEYIQANRHRSVLIEKFHKLMAEYDVLIAPTFGGKQLFLTNLTGHPSICLPNGFDKKGRPTSITLVGNLYDESSIINLAIAFQDATEHEEKFPPMFSK
ncbi:MAG: amidase [Bacteroidetes bacterium]|nr:MAG: amidase [Bacteroidota bacterium]